MGKPGQLKRRHHTVPRFHLERFSNDCGQFVRIALPGDKRDLVAIRDASVEKDFYLIESEDGTRSDELENRLGDIEGAAAGAVRALIDECVWPIPEHVRWDIAAWVASQALRTTAQRQAGSEIADMVFKLRVGAGGKPQIRRDLLKVYGREPTVEEIDAVWKTATDFDSYAIRAHPHTHLQTMTNLMPGTTCMFHDRGWTLIYFRRKALVSGDNPVVLMPARGHPPEMGIGVLTAGRVLVPLSRRVALLMNGLGEPDFRVRGTSGVAAEVNARVAWNCQQAIFHHPADDPLAGIELPEAGRAVLGGYDQVKKMIVPEGTAALFRRARSAQSTTRA